MAQALYREWFVRFRFPGHQSVPLVDSPLGPIPQGWRVKTLGEIVDAVEGTVRTGPFGSQLHESDYTAEGVPVVMPKNIMGGRVVIDDIARIPEDEADRLSQHRLHPGDIVYGRRGDIGRRSLIGIRQDGWMCGTGCLRISLGENQLLSSTILYLYLGLDEVVKSIANRAIGATLPNLNTTILRDTLVLCPPWPLQQKAAEAIADFFAIVDTLIDQNSNLRRTRDLLLPKLVSGEVDVSGMESAYIGESQPMK
jgi:type I restriction enzyme S subunit